ncbi:MAG: 50S ribosomal protein L29 [Bdellovibrionales bacterium]|nr:50S ribosomal protein L29 [Bdellovibrionales bacterium]
MKYSEISHLDKKELWKRFSELKKKLFDSKMQLKMKRLSNPLSLRFLRRDIARIQTVLNKKARESGGKK